MADDVKSLRACADRQMNDGDASQALETYNEVLARAPDDIEALEGKAAALALEGRYTEALECHNALVASGTDRPSRLQFRSKILVLLGRYVEAIVDLDAALAAGGSPVELLRDKAMCLQRAGRLSEAAEAYQQALGIARDDPTTLAGLGDLLLDIGSVSAAMETFESASRTGAGFTELDWVSRGNRLLAAGQAEEALGMFRAANAVRPTKEAWRGIAQAHLDLRQYADAAKAAGRTCELAPEDALVWHIRALALSGLGRRSEALESFRKATTLDPQFETAWSDRAMLLSDLERFEEAIEVGRRAIDINPGSAKLWRKLGLYLYHSDDHQGALDSWKHALTLDPQSAWAANNASIVLNENKRYEEALELIDHALSIDNTEDVFWCNKADILEGLGRAEDAIKLLESGMDAVRSPKDLVRRKVRLLCDTLGRTKDALDVLATAAQTWPSDNQVAGDFAELLLINGRYDEAKNLASTIASCPETNPVTRCAMRFAILTAHVLTSGLADSDRYLTDFTICYMRTLTQIGKARLRFGYEALRPLLLTDSVSVAERLLLLTLIDVQEQRISPSSLSFFEGLEPETGGEGTPDGDEGTDTHDLCSNGTK